MKPQRPLSSRGLPAPFSLRLLVLASTNPAFAEGESGEDAERLERVEAKVDALTDEVGRLESIFAVPEELEFESFSGLGPAASKVYKRESGLSIGGYGEVLLRTFPRTGGRQPERRLRCAPRGPLRRLQVQRQVGVQLRARVRTRGHRRWRQRSRPSSSPIDYLHRDELNFRAGVLLVPMGFVNEIHEPNFFYGAQRPEVERRIMPSTWRENGAGIFGTIADRVHYRMYVVNGFDGEGFDGQTAFRGGRQKASRALSDDFAFVGRVDVDVTDGLLIGGSVYAGQSGQEQRADEHDALVRRVSFFPDLMTHIYEIHAQYRGNGFSFRGLWSEAFVDEAGAHNRILGSGLASRMQGWYVEGGLRHPPALLRHQGDPRALLPVRAVGHPAQDARWCHS